MSTMSTEEKDADPPTTGGEAEKQSKSNGKHSLVDQTNYLPPRQIIIVCVALNMALILAFLDQTAVSTALPSIVASFAGESSGRLSPWIASAYLLTSTAFQPTIGRLSDIFGRKFVLQGCILVFAVGSLACAVAQTMVSRFYYAEGTYHAPGRNADSLLWDLDSVDYFSSAARGRRRRACHARAHHRTSLLSLVFRPQSQNIVVRIRIPRTTLS